MKHATLITVLATLFVVGQSILLAGDDGPIKEHHYKWSKEIMERQEAEIEARCDSRSNYSKTS